MIKVLFFIHDLMHGGAEKVLVNLVNNMDSDKFDITVMTLFNEGVHIKNLNPNITYKYVFRKSFRGNSKLLSIFSPKLLYKLFIKDEYDIAVSYLEGSCTRIISGADSKIKKIAWVHISQKDKEFYNCYKSYDEVINSYKKFNKIVCVSQGVKENFIKLSNIYNNTIVLYNTNESEKIINLSKEKINNKNFDENSSDIKICAIGKILPNKGFMRLARVHKKLLDEGYNYHIYILGIGNQQNEIEEFLKKHNIDKNFTFLGYDENPYKYLNKSDLFICTSFAEGFSTAATEALIVGTPVLTTDCAGMKEMLGENNEYGIIVENSEEGIYKSLKSILENKDILKYYKRQAIERGKNFNTENTVKEVEEMLLEVYGG